MSGRTHPLYLLLLSLLSTDGLRLTMKAPLISVMRDADVTIPCEVSDFSFGQTITVSWTKSHNGHNTEVYRFIPGRPQAFREGSYMEEESEILRGNAALHIPRVQFSDDGEYICTVIVTPDFKEGRSTLQVSAEPSAVLTPGDDIKVELGTEKVVSCDISNFYPKDINIRWVRLEKNSVESLFLEKNACTGDPITNPDGTFSTTSHLTLYPIMEDDGYKYSCVVKHRSLHQDLMKNFTLTVTEREDATGRVAAAVLMTLLAVTLLFFGGFLYCQVIRKDPPILSEIIGNDLLTDMNRTTLTCNIMNFKPNAVEISVCLKRRGEEMKTIHTWRSGDPASSPRARMNDGDSSVDIDVERQSLMNGAANHTQRPLHLDMSPVITANRPGLLRCIPWGRLPTYSCQCSVHITPSFTEDNEAELFICVSHPALTGKVSEKRRLRVIGVAPMLLKIVSPVYMTHKTPMMLTCPINGFKPKPLQIIWLKKDQGNRETELVTWNSNDGTNRKDDFHKVTENEHADKSYSFLSAFTIKPSVREDDAVTYICRTFHPATEKWAEEALDMVVTAVPELGPIKQTEERIYVGEKIRLSCKIHSFYPAPIEVTWYKEDEELLPSVLSDLLPDQSGLYQVTSTISYTPTMKDLRKTFTCKVKHESTGDPKTATWKLDDLVSAPEVSGIRCLPAAPESGKPVTLSCDVSKLYPKNFVVNCYKGVSRMPSDKCKDNLQEDLESGTFRAIVEWNFIADPGCHGEEFRMELIHCGKTIERKYTLNLEGLSGFPVLSDITGEPLVPSYGQPVTLCCKVTNSNPQDIKITWLKGDKPLEKGQGEEKQVTEKDGSISCSLRITATALDFAKAYTCSVRHKNMIELLKKNHYLSLPDKAPIFSDISVRPEVPDARKDATFTVTISGFTPDIRVKWYKGFSSFPSDVVTTSDPQIGKDFLLSCSSSLRFTPQDKDHEASIRCEATHSVTKKVHEQTYTLLLSGGTPAKDDKCPPLSRRSLGHLKAPVKTRGIQCLTESPRVGDEVTLTCYVDGCDADSSQFSWRKGMFPIDGEIQNKTLEDRSGSFSTVTFTAQETDRDCTITCEVEYNFQTEEEHFTLKLL